MLHTSATCGGLQQDGHTQWSWQEMPWRAQTCQLTHSRCIKQIFLIFLFLFFVIFSLHHVLTDDPPWAVSIRTLQNYCNMMTHKANFILWFFWFSFWTDCLIAWLIFNPELRRLLQLLAAATFFTIEQSLDCQHYRAFALKWPEIKVRQREGWVKTGMHAYYPMLKCLGSVP